MIDQISWIHWDPPIFAFKLPYFERPIAWYGILFAFGFILGFLLIVSLFKNVLSKTTQILDRDILSWPLLINHLKKVSGSKNDTMSIIFGKLNEKSREYIKSYEFKREPDDAIKQDILNALNSSMIDVKLQLSRSQLEGLFPKAIHLIKDLSIYLADRILWFVIGGTLIGARLGHVFFYEWPRYKQDPLAIFKVWEGGLASHGGTLAIIIAVYLYYRMIRPRFPEFTFIGLLDILCIPTALAIIWIRVGNFVNQEILGTVTTVPWAIIFAHPYDGSAALPRHPAQLYEALAYALIFVCLYTLWKKRGNTLRTGTIFGLFMTSVFGARFLIEFVKAPQSLMIDESLLNTGHYLSIPFILLGLALLFIKKPTPLYNKVRHS